MKRFQFGPFTLDANGHYLARDGNLLPLPPKAFDTLVYLVANPGRLVTREELIAAIWPNSFVEDGSLSVNISLIRKTLGSGSNGETFIETVPRRGYRFRSSVTSFDSRGFAGGNNSPGANLVGQLQLDPPAPADQSSFLSRNRGRLAAGLIGLFVLATSLGWYLRDTKGSRETAPFASMHISRLTARGNVATAIISPDGKYVAYTLNEAGGQSVWIRQIATTIDLKLLGSEGGAHSSLTFSPDGNYLFDMRPEDAGDLGLYRMPVLGGPATKLLSGIIGPISFSPDGREFAFVRSDLSKWRMSLTIAKTDTIALRTIAARTRPAYFAPDRVAWSRDGRFIYCFAGNSSDYIPGAFLVERVRIADGAETSISSHAWAWSGPLALASDGSKLFAAAGNERDALQIWSIFLPHGSVARVTNDLSDYGHVSLSRADATLAAVQKNVAAALWTARADHLEAAVPVSAGEVDGINTVTWTPDGKILYSAHSAGEMNIFIANAGTGLVHQVTATPQDEIEVSSTPDNRFILYQSQGKIWRMNRDGSNPVKLTNGAHDVHPFPSPDGRTVVYASFADWSPAVGGKPALWSVSIDGGKPKQLTALATSLPQISPDGRWLAALYYPVADPRFSQAWLAVFNSGGGDPIHILKPSPSRYGRLHWAPDSKALDFISRTKHADNIWRQPLSDRPPVQLTHFEGEEIFDFCWSHDAKQLVLSRGRETSDVVLIKGVD